MYQPKYLSKEEIGILLNESGEEDNCSLSDISDEEYVPEHSQTNGRDISESESGSETEDLIPTNEVNTVDDHFVSDPLYVSKDGTIWQPEPFHLECSGRFRNENILNLTPGVTRFAKSRVDNIKDAFQLFFPPHLENIILVHTNAFAKAKYGDEYMRIDSSLLQAYIGVLILAGVYR